VNYPASLNSSQGVATSTGLGWRNAAELGGDIKRNTQSATFLANSGIPTYIDSKHAIAHNKIMVIDKETVITGSFNFTKAAEEKNAENLLILKNKEMASQYLMNWSKHKNHSDSYSGRE
jgi:phosphatidylserine/phosphatidylglycerophosphate/cardiolipin synthase-like enzyme